MPYGLQTAAAAHATAVTDSQAPWRLRCNQLSAGAPRGGAAINALGPEGIAPFIYFQF